MSMVARWLDEIIDSGAEYQINWKKLPEMISGQTLFGACPVTHQCRSLPETTNGTKIYQFNSWTSEARRVGHVRGELVDFYDKEVNALKTRKLRCSYAVRYKDWEYIEPV